MVRIQLFASLQDVVGTHQLEWRIDGPATIRTLFEELVEDYPGLERYSQIVRVALNEEYSSWQATVQDGDEVAFFPPVSGGRK